MEAYIQTYLENGNLVIENIFVPNELRGQGIAKKMMQELIENNKNIDIELHAYPQDEQTDINKLVEFYESFGFEIIGGSEDWGFEMILNN
jgi:ribosomal protein S18 acetylase RimI-like enzyme